MDFLALSDFRLVAFHGSFAKASRISGRPKATLSRRVRELEDDLGVRLFERDPKRLRLTEEGQLLNQRAEHVLSEMEAVRDEVAAGTDRPRGKLRVCAPILFSHVALGRVAAAFVAKFPDVFVETVMLDRPVDLDDEGFDILIQINPDPQAGLIGRCFLRDHAVIVAPAKMTSLLDGGDDPTAAIPVPTITTTGMPERLSWHVDYQGRALQLAPKTILRLASRVMVRDAVRSGLGAAELPESIVANDLAAGTLVCWGPAPQEAVELWVLYTSRRLVSRKVSAFVQFLCESFPNASFPQDWTEVAVASH